MTSKTTVSKESCALYFCNKFVNVSQNVESIFWGSNIAN